MSNVVNIDGSFAKPRYRMDAMWVGIPSPPRCFFLGYNLLYLKDGEAQCDFTFTGRISEPAE